MRFQPKLKLIAATFGLLAALGFIFNAEQKAAGQQSRQIDPAIRGKDHVGKTYPQLSGSDKCLNCHRADVGRFWIRDWHFLTLRGKYHEDHLAPEIETLDSHSDYKTFTGEINYILGGRDAVRFLKRSSDSRFELLTIGIKRRKEGHPAKWFATAKSDWESSKFSEKCEGCHTSGLNSETKLPFEYFVGCESCHGPYNPKHANNAAFIRFSKKSRETAQMIASTCGSCHLRGGRSRSTDRPWPNNFVAGDNMFKDFVFDFALSDDPYLNPIDKHVQQNIRDIAMRGKVDLTCLSCHALHPSNTEKHQQRQRSAYCMICHESDSYKSLKHYEAHSSVCEY